MSSAVFRRSRRVRCRQRALAGAASPSRFAIQRLVIGDVLAGRDVLAKSPDRLRQDARLRDPARRPHRRRPPRPAALVLAPTRELASQIVEESRAVAHARALKIAAVYGGVGIAKQAARPPQGPHPRGHARPARGPARAARRLARARALPRLDEADRMLDMGFRPGRRPDRRPLSRQAPDDVLLGDAGGRGGPRRSRVHARRRPTRACAPGAAQGRDRASLRRGRAQPIASTRWSASCARNATWRSCSCAPSAARTGSSSGCARSGVAAVAMHGNKSQGQRERPLASFEAGRWTRSSPPTSPPAASTSTGISHVINFDPPADRDGYVHRVGRTGRAGADRHRDHARRRRAGARRRQNRAAAEAARRVRRAAGLGTHRAPRARARRRDNGRRIAARRRRDTDAMILARGHPQRRDRRARRSRQDDARRRDAVAVRRLSREPGRGRARAGLDGPRAREGHHDPGQEHRRPAPRREDQHHRHAGPRRLRRRGRARL